jgi:hypothetical protein
MALVVGSPARELVLTLFDRPAEQDERLGAQDQRLEKLERRLGHGFGWTSRVNLSSTGEMELLAEEEVVGAGRSRTRPCPRAPGSVVTWRRAQIVLLSAQAMTPGRSARWCSPTRTSRGR